MSDWKLIKAAEFENRVENPSLEQDTRGWEGDQGMTISRVGGSGIYGYYALRGSPSAGSADCRARAAVKAGPGVTYASVWFKGGSGVTYKFERPGLTLKTFTGNGDWQFVEGTGLLGGRLGFNFGITRSSPTSDNTPIYLDGMQFSVIDGDNASYEHTYTDGERPETAWLGEPHNAPSFRPATSLAGGAILDFESDYGITIEAHVNTGANPQSINIDNFAVLPGGQINSIGYPPRSWTLVGTVIGSGLDCDIHEARAKAIEAFYADAVPENNEGPQFARIRYEGATTTKEIAGMIDTGFQGDIGPNQRIHEPVALRFISQDPFWYATTDSSGTLQTLGSQTLEYVARRDMKTGAWGSADINTGGGGKAYAMYLARSGSLFLGGDFTGWDPSAGSYAVRYDRDQISSDKWDSIGGSATFDDIVWAIAGAPNGDVYLAGQFSKAGGGSQDYIGRWDGNNLLAVGEPGSGAANITAIYSLHVRQNGDVVVGGTFSTFGNAASADNIALYSGGSWVAVGNGLNNQVFAVSEDNEDRIWAGGAFTADGDGGTLRRIGYYDTAWVEPGGGLNNGVYALENTRRGMFAGGLFTQSGNGSISGLNLVARFNNTAWESLGSGLTSAAAGSSGTAIVNELQMAPDGKLWVGGVFDETVDGELDGLRNLAVWTGQTWTYTDLASFGADVTALEIGRVDPSNSEKYEVFVGYNSQQVGFYSGQVTITNDGTARARPQIIIRRTAGTDSDRLKYLRNETTGKTLAFNGYKIQTGDRIVIDFGIGQPRVTSLFQGDISYIISPGSDENDFYLGSLR